MLCSDSLLQKLVQGCFIALQWDLLDYVDFVCVSSFKENILKVLILLIPGCVITKCEHVMLAFK